MAGKKGRLMLLEKQMESTPGSFEAVGGLRTTGVTINNELVDITDKQSGGWRELLPDAGVRSVSIAGSGVFKDTDTEKALMAMAFDGSLANFRVRFEDGDAIVGSFQVANFAHNGDYNQARAFDLTLESSGEVEFDETT